MNSDDLKYKLIRGLDIYYNGILVKQPTIQDIDKIGLLSYLSMSYIFRIQKEHLQLYDEIKDKLQGKSLFESIIIQEEILNEKRLLEKDEDFNMKDSMIMLLIQSLCFFLGIKDFHKIEVADGYEIIVNDIEEIDGQVIKIPIFKLNNNNFDEFSELIRIITCNDILEIEKDNKVKIRKYKDPSIQKRYEQLMKQLKQNEEKKKNENSITVSDIVGSVCTNNNTKYNYINIEELTVWQLFYEFNNMFTFDNINTIKQQYNSGNFEFKTRPDLNWFKKIKIKLPESNKLIND